MLVPDCSPDFSGEVDLNLALGLLASFCSCNTGTCILLSGVMMVHKHYTQKRMLKK